MPDWGTLLLVALGSGVAGWALERVVTGTARYSPALGGAASAVPFLPVYALGGVALAALEPAVSGWSWPARGLAYGTALTAVEAAAGLIDRGMGSKTWDYSGRVVDVPHAIAWGALGLALEPLAKTLPRKV